MKYFQALWQALMTFFTHLRHVEKTERAEQQAVKDAQKVQESRSRLDAEVQGASQRDRDSRLSKWMRD